MQTKVAVVVNRLVKQGVFMKNIIISKDELIELCATSYEVGHRGYADQSNDFVENLVEDFLKEVDSPEISTRLKPSVSSNEITFWGGDVPGNTDNSVLSYGDSISDHQSIVVTANPNYDVSAYTSTAQIEIPEYDSTLNLTVDKNET